MQKKNYTSVGKFLHMLNSYFRRTELQEWTCLEKRNKIKLYIILYNMHTYLITIRKRFYITSVVYNLVTSTIPTHRLVLLLQ